MVDNMFFLDSEDGGMEKCSALPPLSPPPIPLPKKKALFQLSSWKQVQLRGNQPQFPLEEYPCILEYGRPN